MPIRYRCHACEQLLSIATRMVGQVVNCPTCGARTIVPEEDETGPAVPVPSTMDVIEPRVPQTVTGSFVTSSPESRVPDAITVPVPPTPVVLNAPAPGKATVPVLPTLPPVSSTSGRRMPAATEPEESPSGFVVRGRHADVEEMDLTPMVDMTFLLLIFFMITASFAIQKTIEVPAPSAEQKGAAQTLQSLDELENNSISVRVDEHNAIFIEDERIPDRSQLIEALRRVMRTARKRELLLNASDAACHETVVSVIDAANAAGMQKIRMVSHAGDVN